MFRVILHWVRLQSSWSSPAFLSADGHAPLRFSTRGRWWSAHAPASDQSQGNVTRGRQHARQLQSAGVQLCSLSGTSWRWFGFQIKRIISYIILLCTLKLIFILGDLPVSQINFCDPPMPPQQQCPCTCQTRMGLESEVTSSYEELDIIRFPLTVRNAPRLAPAPKS